MTSAAAASHGRAIRLGVALAVLALALVAQFGAAPASCDARVAALRAEIPASLTAGVDCPAPRVRGAPAMRVFGVAPLVGVDWRPESGDHGGASGASAADRAE